MQPTTKGTYFNAFEIWGTNIYGNKERLNSTLDSTTSQLVFPVITYVSLDDLYNIIIMLTA